MARISGVNIPTNKRVLIALTYIYGIGPKIAGEICSKASIDLSKRVNQLTDEEVNKIREIIDNKHQVEGANIAMGHAYGGASQFFAMWIVGKNI